MNENKTKEVINKIKLILQENESKFVYRNLGLISTLVKIHKTDLLKILVNCPEFKMVFNDENYSPNAGPLFALSNIVKEKEKENKSILREELKKEKEEKIKLEKEQAKKKEKKKTIKKKPKKPTTYANKKRVKEATKLLIKCHSEFNIVLKKYSLSLFRSDKEYMNNLTRTMSDFTKIISEIINKNNFTEEDLK